jgi:endonuclease/exonuclease/phosphatase family metal-dependent hydrolase
VHTHQQPSAAQEQQAANLLALVPSEHTIVMGDFNATPDSATTALMTHMFANTDLTNTPTWSMHYEGCTVCKPQKVDTRLDYIFVTRDIEVVHSQVEQSSASDHLPISTIIRI